MTTQQAATATALQFLSSLSQYRRLDSTDSKNTSGSVSNLYIFVKLNLCKDQLYTYDITGDI